MYRPPPPPPPAATLAANLAQAQAALNSLISGDLTASVSYAEGSGSRSVTYTRAQIAELRLHIENLQTQQGYRGRRAIGVRF